MQNNVPPSYSGHFKSAGSGFTSQRSADIIVRPGPAPLRPANVIYVGIDFGTSRSGYAYAYGADSKPALQFTWPGETIQQAKTVTAILYDRRTWDPIAWGMEASIQ